MSQGSSGGGVETAGSLVNEAVEGLANSLLNETAATNGTAEADKFKASPQGLLVAYSSLVILALIPIVVGSFKSVKHQKKQQESGEEIETMSTKEAMMFPVIASVTLFGIYLVFQIFSKEHINLLLAFYFFLLGVIALTRMLATFVAKVWPHSLLPNEHYEIDFAFRKGSSDKKKTVLGIHHLFDREAIAAFLIALAIGVWYLLKKHWIANNIFGLAFAVNGIEFLQLNKVLNGCILLGGLFFYDIFWVFGTNVMVTVAKSFDAPIKLIFPQDLIENGLNAQKYALLGLGDIVIPGIFIALLLRFDLSLPRKTKVYFYSSFIAYILALFCTIFVMHVFKHAQPALLYIVPLCLIVPLTVALILGDIKSMFSYRDHEEVDPNASKTSENNNNTSVSEASGSEQTASSAPSSPVSAATAGKKEAKKTK